jgi:hypothetical protein
MLSEQIDRLREALALASSYANTPLFLTWALFVLSFPVALWILVQTLSLWLDLDGISGRTKLWLMVTPAILVVFIGIPVSTLILQALWESFDVYPKGRIDGFFAEVKASAIALALHWTRLVYSFLPIVLIPLPFEIIALLPGVRGRIKDEIEEIKTGIKPSKSRALVVRQEPEITLTTPERSPTPGAIPKKAPIPFGLVPEPPEGEKLPDGWTYRPEPPGGH